MGEIKSMES